MPESISSRQYGVFPFPPTPHFNTLTDVWEYFNKCGFDITWQSFYCFYLDYTKKHAPSARQRMTIHSVGNRLEKQTQQDKISMPIAGDFIEHGIKPEMKRAIELCCANNRNQMVDRMYQCALRLIPEIATWKYHMNAHLNTVVAAICESLDIHNSRDTNVRYLTRLYMASIKAISSTRITKCPESWFAILSDEQNINLDIFVPRFSRCYVNLYRTFGDLLEEESPNQKVVRNIRDEMKKTLITFGCSAATEKSIYLGCARIIEDIDRGIIGPDEFDEKAYSIVSEKLGSIARRSIVDTTAHASVTDRRATEFLSELFDINMKDFERCRVIFANKVVRYMVQDSDPHSSADIACGVIGLG